jgi:hypothetical protein
MAPGLSSLLKNKGYALKFLLNKPEVLLIKERFLEFLLLESLKWSFQRFVIPK